jgi:hypothetical protein
MYSPVDIEGLTRQAFNKILNGGSVRVRPGKGQTLHLTKEQIKKLIRASNKGAASTITFDPYQQANHKGMMKGGTALIDQPFTVRQAYDRGDDFVKNPLRTFGFGAKMKGGTALIDQPFTVRQAYDRSSDFIKNPLRTVGFGAKKKGQGGTALIDQPFTVRQAYDRSSDFVKNPLGTVGFGFWDNVGAAFTPPKDTGRKIASTLIHQGIPIAASTLGGIAGTTIGGLSSFGAAAPIGGLVGSEAGNYAGTQLGDYIGSKTGYGFRLKRKTTKKKVKATKKGKGVFSSALKFAAPHLKNAAVYAAKEVGKALLKKGIEKAASYADEKGVPPEIIQEARQRTPALVKELIRKRVPVLYEEDAEEEYSPPPVVRRSAPMPRARQVIDPYLARRQQMQNAKFDETFGGAIKKKKRGRPKKMTGKALLPAGSTYK